VEVALTVTVVTLLSTVLQQSVVVQVVEQATVFTIRVVTVALAAAVVLLLEVAQVLPHKVTLVV
jgi:uncharacterized membrane protein